MTSEPQPQRACADGKPYAWFAPSSVNSGTWVTYPTLMRRSRPTQEFIGRNLLMRSIGDSNDPLVSLAEILSEMGGHEQSNPTVCDELLTQIIILAEKEAAGKVVSSLT